MDQSTIIMYVVQALGGVVSANIIGALLHGGGGAIGRTILGALGGIGAGYAAGNVAQVSEIAANWSGLLSGEPGVHLSNLITGAAGGGALGLIGGLLIRPRN
ncbi:MAG: hypothetical protein AB7O04_01985 [Hyphomonadaceae bacterium]